MYWRDSGRKPVEQYRLTRLVFGLTGSPYIAMRCVRQLAEESAFEFTEASRVLREDIFMDDILSLIAKLCDPIGIISPIIIKAKILMQSLWTLCLDWDQTVPDHIRNAWEKYMSEL